MSTTINTDSEIALIYTLKRISNTITLSTERDASRRVSYHHIYNIMNVCGLAQVVIS